MAVYTNVSADDLAAWLTRYALGAVHEFEPIVAGIENTNYFLTADNGRFVLTLYERTPAEELPFYLNMMAHLAHAGVQAPAPEADRSGALWSFLNGKPAGLVARLCVDAIDAQRVFDAAHDDDLAQHVVFLRKPRRFFGVRAREFCFLKRGARFLEL